MDSQQVVRHDLPPKIAKELRRLMVGAWTPNYGQYGPKKYCIRDIHYKPLSEFIPHLQLRSDDVWIGGYPRSGTHWMAEMTWLINNNLDFDTARKVNHHDRVGFFEFVTIFEDNPMQPPTTETYDKKPSTRFFKTHVPLSLLPPKLLETSKMIYVARDPRDMLVSLYHFVCDWEFVKFQGTIQELFELFIQDNFDFCPYFENVLEYWNARHHKNLLFFFYEDMVKDLPSVVRRISKFFDKEFTESQYEQLCEYLQFGNMKNSNAFRIKNLLAKDVPITRKGKIGGWQEEFTEDMKKRMELWIAKKLKDTDLVFPSMQRQ